MYEKVNKNPRERKDRLLLAALLAALVLVISVTPAIVTALSASWRYHKFVQQFAGDLSYSRRKGEITVTENGETKPVSADKVSSLFLLLTEYSFGQPLRKAPQEPGVTVTLEGGATLTIWDTPKPPAADDPDPTPRGITVRYVRRDGKTFIYLQRQIKFEIAAAMIR